MPRSYVPDAGDVVSLDFTPQAGREQGRHQPALVLSPAAYTTHLRVVWGAASNFSKCAFAKSGCFNFR